MDSYDDKYGAIVDTSKAGEVTVTLDGVTVRVFAAAYPETEQRAIYEATEAKYRGTDPKTGDAAKRDRSLCEWKSAAYSRLLAASPSNASLQAKSAYWSGRVTTERGKADAAAVEERVR